MMDGGEIVNRLLRCNTTFYHMHYILLLPSYYTASTCWSDEEMYVVCEPVYLRLRVPLQGQTPDRPVHHTIQ